MMNPVWDLDVSPRQFKRVLRHSRDERFPNFFVRVLSRVPFREVFHRYITPQQFKKYYPKFRRRLESDLIGAGRTPFWNWLHRRLSVLR